jgi:glutamate N-acetyltransferase/amino-acid N-acetyltransferase
MDIKVTGCGICIDNFKAFGIKDGKYGVALIVNDEVCETAGVFTRNSVKGAHIIVDGKRVRDGLRAIVINSGNANACVESGVRDAERMCEIAGRELSIDPLQTGVASTGIIGRKLDLEKIENLTKKAASGLSNSPEGSEKAAKAIMTTDSRFKQVSFEYKGIEIGGIAKGSGMIAPDLATMLCFLTTNAALNRETLQNALERAVRESFNLLVIDGDMSTNDTVLLMSNGKKTCNVEDFQYLLDYVTREIAKLMALDGEGATKFLEVEVLGAKTEVDAREGAKAIVSSSLLKTAVFGENPNWGRIVAALGSRIEFDFEKTDIVLESKKSKACVVRKGRVMDIDKARDVLRGKEIRIVVNLNSGNGRATAWGCDLTPEYVSINAGYN